MKTNNWKNLWQYCFISFYFKIYGFLSFSHSVVTQMKAPTQVLPRLLCVASKNIIAILHNGNSWPFIVAKRMEVGGTPPVSRGIVNQLKVRMSILQLFFQPIVDENFDLLTCQNRGIFKRHWVRCGSQALPRSHESDRIRLPLGPVYRPGEEDDLCEVI